MAKRTIHVLVDDIDGGEADETVKFSLDGVQYEIDLSKKNASKLRDAFAPYVASGTKIGRGGVVVGGYTRSATRALGGGSLASQAYRTTSRSQFGQAAGNGLVSGRLRR